MAGLPDADQVKGKARTAYGEAEEALGHLQGDPELEAQGAEERQAGRTQALGGAVKKHVGDAINDVEHRFGS